MSRPSRSDDAAAKNRPLVDDIRLLGRILGDVIREQEGAEAFELIERVRQLSVAYRLKKDASAGRVLDRLLKNLSGDQTVSVIRAFSYFCTWPTSPRTATTCAAASTTSAQGHLQEGSLAMAFERLRRADIRAAEIAQTLAQAYISPVLTAHPTEVQRKSILDAERAIAELVGQRDDLHTERDRADNEALMRARVTQLWQTRMLRTAKLTVADEIENALSYYQATFLRQIPRLYRELEHALPGHAVAPFLRMGHWIGGDRDGNPNVGAPTLELALARQAEVALRFYLTEVHELGAELSISQHAGPGHARDARAGRALARPQPAPRGRALPPRADRHVRPAGRHAARADRHRGAAPRRGAAGRLRRAPTTCWPTCSVIEAFAEAHHAQALIAPRLAPLMRAVQVFGFHLATLDLRQSSDQHEAVVAELLRAARHRARLRWRWPRRRGASGCWRCSTMRARCACTARSYSALARRASWRSSKRRARHWPASAAQAIRHYIISHTEEVSDLLEVLLLQKECRA